MRRASPTHYVQTGGTFERVLDPEPDSRSTLERVEEWAEKTAKSFGPVRVEEPPVIYAAEPEPEEVEEPAPRRTRRKEPADEPGKE